MKKKLFIIAIAFILSITPVVMATKIAYAAPILSGVLDCNTGPLIDKPRIDSSGNPVMVDGKQVIDKVYQNPCDFKAAIKLVDSVINLLLFIVAAPLLALILCYAGFILITSGGSSEARTKAKKIIKNVIIGYVIALAAWLIVHAIFKTIGYTGYTGLSS